MYVLRPSVEKPRISREVFDSHVESIDREITAIARGGPKHGASKKSGFFEKAWLLNGAPRPENVRGA